jgi:Ser/Thr protein kinase RdoA (MazF antagonist)
MCLDPHVQVLGHYDVGDQIHDVTALGNAGGFSGAKFWRIDLSRRALCMRRWPREHPDVDRLSWMHQVLRHVHGAGVQVVPVPYVTRAGDSFVHYGEHLWELTPWMNGMANYWQASSDRKLVSAMQTLARWHRAAATMSGGHRDYGKSASMRSRAKRLHDLRHDGARQLVEAIRQNRFTVPATCAGEIVERFIENATADVEQTLERAALISCLRQPVIRDIWHDHVLFDGEKVSGIVDFGAMRVEAVAGDVARLLGSLAGDDLRQWRVGMQAYEEIRTLSVQDRELVSAFDVSSVLLSGLQWVEWLYAEGRQFEDWKGVLTRMEANLTRLRRANTAVRPDWV